METYIVCLSCKTIYKKGIDHQCSKVYLPPSSLNNYVLGGICCLAIFTMGLAVYLVLHALVG